MSIIDNGVIMGHIYLQAFGDGTAYVSNPDPVNNERVFLYCTPFSGATLDRIIATDSYDHSIALLQVEEQSFVFRDTWNNMYIEVYFSNSPTPPPPQSFPIWLLFKIKENYNVR